MRATRQRPVSQNGSPVNFMQASALPQRKVFNCIVDDTALVAGVKNATRNGIRQWVKNGQIRLFVPLHAIDELQRQKRDDTRHGKDVDDTLKWLDDATSKYPWAVTLQGGDQYYSDWTEVERFAVPRTLFSEQDHIEDAEAEEPEADSLPDLTAAKRDLGDQDTRDSPASSAVSVGSGSASPSSLQSMRSSLSQVSPPTSPKKEDSSPVKPINSSGRTTEPATSSAMVPRKLQPLFNYILWRVHQELDPVAALESFIFLCNDPQKVHCARGFDIKYKRLEQLREVVGREDRDFRNRLSMISRENQQTVAPAVIAPKEQPDDDDEVVYTRRVGAAEPTEKAQPNAIDPNSFSRAPQPVTPTTPIKATPVSPRFNTVQPARGGPFVPLGPRGAMRGNFRGGPRGRGNFGMGRGGFVNQWKPPMAQANGQIDPDSFARPRGAPAGRGSRKLWEPA